MTTWDTSNDLDGWQPVSSRKQNFVAPAPQPASLPATFWQPPNSDVAAWQPTSAIDERTSAVDRAWGYNIRLIAPLLLAVVLALAGMIAFIVIMRWLETPVDGLMAFLAFLLCLAVTFGGVALHISSDDYRHSHSGVELARIRAAAEVKRAENEQSFELRRAALDGYLKQIGVADD